MYNNNNIKNVQKLFITKRIFLPVKIYLKYTIENSQKPKHSYSFSQNKRVMFAQQKHPFTCQINSPSNVQLNKPQKSAGNVEFCNNFNEPRAHFWLITGRDECSWPNAKRWNTREQNMCFLRFLSIVFWSVGQIGWLVFWNFVNVWLYWV